MVIKWVDANLNELATGKTYVVPAGLEVPYSSINVSVYDADDVTPGKEIGELPLVYVDEDDEPAGILTVTRGGEVLSEDADVYPGDALTARWSGGGEVVIKWENCYFTELGSGNTFNVTAGLELPDGAIYVKAYEADHGALGQVIGQTWLTYVDEAEPEPESYTVAIEPSEHGTVTADKATATQGETVTLTAKADAGYHLAALSVKDADDNSCPTFEMRDPDTDEFIGYGFTMPTSDVTVRAVFSRDEDEGYAVIVASTTGGTVKVNKTTAPDGETIIFTAEPDAGYELDAISVTDAAGNEISVMENTNPTTGESDYRFTMPAGNVTITATFTRAYSIENGWLYVYTHLTELPSGNYTAICVLQNGKLESITTDLPVENHGTITYGTYSGRVTNYGTVTSGTFEGEVNNYDKGTLTDCTFLDNAYNYATINSGSFYDDVYNTGNISSSIFNGIANNHSGGNITDSYFYGDVYNYSGGLIDGGILSEYLVNYAGAEIRNSTIKLDATVISNEGTLTNCKKEHTVEYQTKALTYGANLLSELGDPGTGRIWCEDGVEIAPDATVPLEASSYEHLLGYKVNIAAMENGSITADTYFTVRDKTITLTVTPDEGFVLDTITVTPTVELTGNADGTWSFRMPASDVSVNAAFKSIKPSYIIIIPAGLNLNDTQTLAISVSDVKNMNGKEIVVNVASDGTLECGEYSIGYDLSHASFAFEGDGSFSLGLTVGDTTGKPAGTYEDTLTFTATVQERTGEE